MATTTLTEKTIATLTDQVRKANPGLTAEQAEVRVYEEHPDLFDALLAEGTEPALDLTRSPSQLAERQAEGMARELRRVDRHLTQDEALAHVYCENPHLYIAYVGAPAAASSPASRTQHAEAKSAEAQVEALVKVALHKAPSLTAEQAEAQVYAERPDLFAALI